MALSFPFSASSFCLKSKTIHHIKPSPTLFPTLATKCLRSPIIMNKALVSTSVEGLTRRRANHHANLWDDDFIQSLPNLPYDAPYYRERADKLVGEVKGMFNAVGAADSSTENILKRLEMVDKVERLGIGRYFQVEIAEALDYVYRFWNESSKDLNIAALGLRILRLHRYPVSSDVLEKFKDKDGNFLCCIAESEEEINSILNLFRASLIDFPNEKTMDEAKSFTTVYLNQILQKTHTFGANLLQEITYNLEYGWRTNLSRLEARNYIDIYGEKSSWLKWWKDSKLCKLDFCHHRQIEYHFSGCAITVEPKHSAFRIALAKFSTLATCIDDIYDTYGTLDELELFTKAVKRWDSPSTVQLPEYLKIAYCALYDAINESAREADKIQGRDTLHYARKAWDDYLDSMLREAKWLATRHIPNFQTYLKNGIESSASLTATLQALLTLDKISENDLQKVDYPSRFNDLLGLTLRLRGDTRTFKTEADRGEVASSIACYMRDNPESSEEDALKCINFMLEEHLKELNLEYLKHDNVPICIKDFAYDMSRCFQVFYKERDGFSISSKDMRDHVKEILIDPIKM